MATATATTVGELFAAQIRNRDRRDVRQVMTALRNRRGQPRSLSNQVVAITGGARGIGHATARALAHQGARVAIGDLDGELADRVANGLGGDAFGVGVDVTDNAAFTAFSTASSTASGRSTCSSTTPG